MSDSDTPGTGPKVTKVSAKKRLKAEWRKVGGRQSLKAWAKSLTADEHGEFAKHAEDWLTNKALS